MNKIVLAAIAATVSLVAAPAVSAAPTITITGASGIYGDNNVGCAKSNCSFTRSFTFATPAGFRLASATLSSVMTGTNAKTNINFSSVTLNGAQFDTLSTGVVEFRNILNRVLVPGGTNLIEVSGITGGQGSFSGALSFASGAVPEPATWAMLILGFGVIGTALRRQRKVTTKVAFA
jgi:hypothetical protein